MIVGQRSSTERGLALVSVLWGVALLSLIAVSMLSGSTTAYRLTSYAADRAEAELLADAGINRAILAILDRRPGQRWRTDGTPYRFDFAGTRITVSIQDELGKIDLNAAGGDLMLALFVSAGLDPQSAATMTDRVLDWRDRSPLRRLNGAKLAEYQAAGLTYGPRNGPFQSVSELQLVLGMTPGLFARIAPAITVYSGRPVFDPNLAPMAALLTLPDVSVAKGEAIIAARDQPAASGNGGGINLGTPITGRAFSIRASIATRRGGRIDRHAVIRVTDDPRQPYWVLYWGNSFADS